MTGEIASERRCSGLNRFPPGGHPERMRSGLFRSCSKGPYPNGSTTAGNLSGVSQQDGRSWNKATGTGHDDPGALIRLALFESVLRAKAREADGVRRQDSEMRGLRKRFRFHGGRAAVLLRQAVQERPQTVQTVQGQAGLRLRLRASGDAHRLFGMRDGDHRSFQTYPGPPGIVPQLFPAAAHDEPGELRLFHTIIRGPGTLLSHTLRGRTAGPEWQAERRRAGRGYPAAMQSAMYRGWRITPTAEP